jgi:hypothetical protein
MSLPPVTALVFDVFGTPVETWDAVVPDLGALADLLGC